MDQYTTNHLGSFWRGKETLYDWPLSESLGVIRPLLVAEIACMDVAQPAHHYKITAIPTTMNAYDPALLCLLFYPVYTCITSHPLP